MIVGSGCGVDEEYKSLNLRSRVRVEMVSVGNRVFRYFLKSGRKKPKQRS